MMLFFFFFFQAEDGIRDGRVTGVQTCALPILKAREQREFAGGGRSSLHAVPFLASVVSRPTPANSLCSRAFSGQAATVMTPARSEERRVGKECRSRWSPDL